jgi:hypothetical protein
MKGVIKMGIRKPAVAGSFYPDDADELIQMIDGFLDSAKKSNYEGRMRGVVVPHAGYIFSGAVAASGYHELKSINTGIKKVFLLGPSHYGSFSGVAESGFDEWETPLGKVKIGSMADEIDIIKTIPQVHGPEHSLEVQLPFLQRIMENDFTLYPMLTGDVSPLALEKSILDVFDSESILVASSDLSHFYPYEKALSIDSIANDAIPSLNFEKLKGAEACGMNSILCLMHMAEKKGWQGSLIDYRNSGDTYGDKSKVVGYGCYGFYK